MTAHGDQQIYAAAADRHGFGRYSVVLHAPADLAAALQRFRHEIGMAHVGTEPHVSLVSGLHDLVDLDALIRALRLAAARHAPASVTFETPALHINPDGAAAFRVVVTPELAALRGAVVEAAQGLVRGAPPPGAGWWAHLTLYQGADPAQTERARRLGPALDLGPGFTAASVDLVGRLGSPPGGTRAIIDAAPLQG